MCRTSMEDRSVPILVSGDYDEVDSPPPPPPEEVEKGHIKYRYCVPQHCMTLPMMRIPTLLRPIIHQVVEASGILKVVAGTMLIVGLAYMTSPGEDTGVVRVAMVGNSLMYYNDLPRLLEAMAQGRLHQNSCLHGNADFFSHLWYGNGMYDKWQSGQARIWTIQDSNIYDYGACSVQQLFFGTDERLTKRMKQKRRLEEEVDDAALTAGDDYASVYYTDDGNTDDGGAAADDDNDDDYVNTTAADAWQYNLEDDGTNPCLMDDDYNDYMESLYQAKGRPHWDYVVFNDNSRNPCCTEQRAQSMELLESVYLPWVREIKAIPIFMATYGYWANNRDMSGLTDVPTFTSLTYNGYEDYADLAERKLPQSLQPRIAPVGLAFLLVYEESPSIWEDLMHNDHIHLSPSGTFLEGLIVFYTIFGKMPDTNVFDGEEGPDRLWRWARRMAPVEHQYKPYPTRDTAQYLYHIAHRIMVLGEKPKSLLQFPANTSVWFTPNDELYSDNPERDGSS